MASDTLAIEAIALVARQTVAVVAAVAVVALCELGADVRAAAFVDVDADFGRVAIGASGGEHEAVLTLALNGF